VCEGGREEEENNSKEESNLKGAKRNEELCTVSREQ